MKEIKVGDKVKIKTGAVVWEKSKTNGNAWLYVHSGGFVDDVFNVTAARSLGLITVDAIADERTLTVNNYDCTIVEPAIDYHKRLIDYMEAKAAAIAVQTNGKVRDFFLPEDAEDIQGWNDKKAKNQWRQVLDHFECGSPSRVCPFCNLTSDNKCALCGYGERHGKCCFDHFDNTWGRTMDNLPGLKSAEGFLDKYFTPDQIAAMKAALEGK